MLGTWVPAATEVLPGKSPIVGSPEQATAAKRTLSNMKSDLLTFRRHMTGGASTLVNMSGKSVEKLHDKVENRLLPGASSAAEDLQTAIDAFATHAETVEIIHADARRVIEATEENLNEIRAVSHWLRNAADTLGASSRAAVLQRGLNCPACIPPHVWLPNQLNFWVRTYSQAGRAYRVGG